MQHLQNLLENLEKNKITEYTNYWDNLTPKTNDDYYDRWVFSFLSVHTTWSANVNSYLLLKNNKEAWFHDKQELDRLLREGGCGLYKRRCEGLWLFKYLFWEDPESWRRRLGETWQECRKRLEKRCNGLGYAKTAFALEMCYPTICEVACLDTHMLQLFGHKPADHGKMNSGTKYIALENTWIEYCQKYNVPSYIARCLYWDTKQKRDNSKYWSYVFE